MAATLDVQKSISLQSGLRMEVGTISGDAAYPSGGWPISPGGSTGYWKAIVQASAGYVPEYDEAAQRLKVYRQRDPAAAGGADIALPEVANGTNLATVSWD